MPTRQERAAARRARIERKADTIIAEATARVVAARPASAAQDPATEVKRMRDAGDAWWVIGQKLELAGKADNARDPEAKRGASAARKLYATLNGGEVPRSHALRKGAVAKPTGPARSGTLTSRKEAVVRDGYVIPRDMPDEDVEELLKGRTIQWVIDLARLTDTAPETWGPDDRRWCPQEARVFPDLKWVYCGEEDTKGNRVVRFREYLGRDKNGNMMAGPTRTVRVDAIYNVR